MSNAVKEIDYQNLSIYDLEKEYISLTEENLQEKEEILRAWCKKLYKEGKKDEALAKTKEYLYVMLRQRFIYNESRTFFMFRPISEFMIQDLKDDTLSLSPTDKFNDPIDPPINVWITNNIKTIADPTFMCLLQKATDLLRIRCFVRTSKLLNEDHKLIEPEKQQKIEDISPLMWAHYADGHRGACMEFEIPPSLIKDDGKCSFISLVPIVYEENINIEGKLSISAALNVKSKDWEYEHEVRLVQFDPNMNEEFPLIKGLKLKAVYLGVNCTDVDERKVKMALLNKPIDLYRMNINVANLNRFIAKRIG